MCVCVCVSVCVCVECVFTNNPEHIAPQWNGLKTSLPDCREKLEPSQLFATKCKFFLTRSRKYVYPFTEDLYSVYVFVWFSEQ